MAKRDRSASLTQLLTEATTDGPVPEPERPPAPKQAAEPLKKASKKRTSGSSVGGAKPGERARRASPRKKRARVAKDEPSESKGEATGEGHVRYSDGSYLRADGERRVALQLKMRPDDKQALKVQAAEAGLSPAEYVARLVREDVP